MMASYFFIGKKPSLSPEGGEGRGEGRDNREPTLPSAGVEIGSWLSFVLGVVEGLFDHAGLRSAALILDGVLDHHLSPESGVLLLDRGEAQESFQHRAPGMAGGLADLPPVDEHRH